MAIGQHVEFLMGSLFQTSAIPLAGGKVYTYEPGTTTPKAMYTDKELTTPASNPIVLNSVGQSNNSIYAQGYYKVVFKTSNEGLVSSFDNVFYGNTRDFAATEATNLASGTARSSAITVGQVQDSAPNYVASVGGTANAITLTPAPAITAYATGMKFSFKVAYDNTSSVTLNVSGIGVKNLKKYCGGGLYDLPIAELRSNTYADVQYDGTQFILLNASPIIYRSRVGVVVSNTVTETDLFSVSIKANTLNAYNRIGYKAIVSLNNNTGSNQNYSLSTKSGSGVLGSFTETITDDGTYLGYKIGILEGDFFAYLSTTAQVGTQVYNYIRKSGASTNVYGSATGLISGGEDATADMTLKLTVTLGTASANLSCTSGVVDVFVA